MKILIIAIIFGILGYFVFIYEPSKNNQTENEQLKREYDIKNKTPQGAITETYNTYKNAINDAKTAVTIIENRS